MKYTVQSGKYILKNFFYIIPFAVLPAFLLSLATDEQALVSVLQKLANEDIIHWEYKELFRAISVLNFGSLKSVISGLLGSIMIIVCVAMMMALIEKHFRIGKRTYNGLFSKLNDNLISTAGYVFLILVIYEVWTLLLSAFLYAISRIPQVAVSYPLAAIFFILMHVLLIYIIGALYLWLSCMQFTGFKAMEALHYSNQLLAPLKVRLLGVQLLTLFFAEFLICLCVVLAPNFVFFTIITTVLYAIMIMLYCVRMQIAYFDRDNIERADEKKY